MQISTEKAKSKEKLHNFKTKVTSKHGSFTLNEKAAIQKKKKSCKDQSLVVKMKKGNNLRIYCSTTAFEEIRRQIVRSIQENTNLENIENEDQKGQVYKEILRVKDKHSCGQQVMFTINTYRTKSSFLINRPQVQNIIQEILPWIQSWAQVNKTAIDMCNQQLEKMLRKLDMEQTKVLLEEEKIKLTIVTKGEEVKCDFRIEKETNKKQAQTDGKEYNMNREKNDSKNDKDGNNKDRNNISDKKQELIDNNTVEGGQNAKHELIDSNIVEDSQNAKQELNDSNIEDSENAEQGLNDRNNAEDIKTTEKIRDEEESCKKDINDKMKYTTVRNNKDTDGILKFEKQEVTSGLLESKEREQSNVKNLQNREEQMENQFFEKEKTEENVNTSKKPNKELMEDKALEEELGKNQESNSNMW